MVISLCPHMAKGARELSEISFIFIFKIYWVMLSLSWASQVELVVKNLSVNAGDLASFPGSGRTPGEENGNPLQYSCLGNPTNKDTCWGPVHRVTNNCT